MPKVHQVLFVDKDATRSSDALVDSLNEQGYIVIASTEINQDALDEARMLADQ